MAITGVQLIYRLRETIRLLIDYRTGVDSFNVYCAKVLVGPYGLIANVADIASNVPAIRGKIQLEFGTAPLETAGFWDNNVVNYIKLAPVVGGVEGALEGPLNVPTRVSTIIPKEFAAMYGFDATNQKFIPVIVNAEGKLITTL